MQDHGVHEGKTGIQIIYNSTIQSKIKSFSDDSNPLCSGFSKFKSAFDCNEPRKLCSRRTVPRGLAISIHLLGHLRYLVSLKRQHHDNMSRQKIIWILLVIVLTSFCEAKGSDAIFTMRWDSQIEADLSLANLVCFFQTELSKVVYHMTEGVEYPESQHEQFAGRVHLDRDALKEGRVRLHLSRVTAEDSGEYSCELTADFDKYTGRWEHEATEHFVLNVAQNEDGENVDKPLIKPKSGPTAAEGVRVPSDSLEQEVLVYLRSAVGPIVLVALICSLLLWATCLPQTGCVCGRHRHEQIKSDPDVPPSSRLRQMMKRIYLPAELMQQKNQQPKLLQV
ncbi:hypothetical protein Q5P01_002777 [Channa striata]|uniref:Ig-like domain-containing protein n=1 Tax=Channa striata TaxID=64152 RepID=A0AA88NUW0_CHASR|nr:hypothetical protein Q5P01_002777 [Channa striata]